MPDASWRTTSSCKRASGPDQFYASASAVSASDSSTAAVAAASESESAAVAAATSKPVPASWVSDRPGDSKREHDL